MVTFDETLFNNAQLLQIKRSIEDGFNILPYVDQRFDVYQMSEIEYGLRSHVDVSIYAKPEFTASEMAEIRYGLESGIDPIPYADPKYDWFQMNEIRKAITDFKVPIMRYVNPESSAFDIEQIALALYEKVNIDILLNHGFDPFQMREIRMGLKNMTEEKVLLYADPKYTSDQMRFIRIGLEKLPIDQFELYSDPSLSAIEIFDIVIRLCEESGIDCSEWY